MVVITYYGLNVKNITNKYCINKDTAKLNCNGKCYLKKKLNFSTEAPYPYSGKKNINVSEVFIPVFLNSLPQFSLNQMGSNTTVDIPKSKENISEQAHFFKIEYPPEVQV